MPRREFECKCGLADLRHALLRDEATRFLVGRRPSGLWAAIATDASKRLSGVSRSANPPVLLALPAPALSSDPLSIYLREKRDAELS
jgi:hypothetical protein